MRDFELSILSLEGEWDAVLGLRTTNSAWRSGGTDSYCHPGLLLLIKAINLILYSNDQQRSWKLEQKLNSDLNDERLLSNAAILPNAMLQAGTLHYAL